MKLQSFFGDASLLKVCKLIRNYAIKFYKCSGKKLLPNAHQKMFFDIRTELVKHSVVHGCLFTYYLTKELEKTHPSVITLLMANILWTILITQNYIDFYSWEKRTCTRKLLLNFVQTSRNNK